VTTFPTPTPPLKGRGFDKGWNPQTPLLQRRGLGWGLSNEQIEWLHQRVREMRRNPTEPEKRLWRNLSNSQFERLKFRRQEVIGLAAVGRASRHNPLPHLSPEGVGLAGAVPLEGSAR
jgi:hypothetical protein